MSYYTEKLGQVLADPLQKKAYDSPDSTVVIAGPGSGKTTILTLKIMKLLNSQIKEPHGLACLTFSREAAREFEDRLKQLGYEKRRNVFLGTVHSFCISEILSNFANLYDYGIKLPIKVLPSKLDKKIYESVLKDLGIRKFNKTEVDKERSLHITGMSGIHVESNETAYRIAKEYERRVLESGYIDYESIILYSTKMLQEHGYVRKCISAKYPWLVIDEYQDLGRPLHEMVMSLFTQTEIKIFAVGDPDQSIYGFSGAIPDYLMELYNREDTISVKLVNNYRSNQDIIDGSETVLNIPRNYHAMTREGEKAVYRFITCQNGLEEQFQFFIEKVIPACQQQKIPLEEIAVLLGKNDDCNSLALMCMERNIPYYISRHNFERTDFVKWLEACSVWINDKGEISFDELYAYWENIIVMHRAEKYLSEADCLSMKKRFLNILSKSVDEKDNLKEWLYYMFSNLKVGPLLRNSEVLPDELDNLKKLYAEVSDEKYKDYTTKQFSQIGKPINQITITTRHSSKGLEFEVVVMMGMEEKHFPGWYVDKNPKALFEENRICFVCISRAKRVCILMHSNYYDEYDYRYDSICSKRYYPSRYINELKKKFE
ncbi:MAG: ATP-dependent helicase [Lachnospiraceae bacterium]